METFCTGVLENIVANILFWVVGGLGLWLIILTGRRRALRNFFGFKQTDKYVIYLSSYTIERHTVKDRNGVLRGHEGIAIPEYEFQTIPILSSVISNAGKLIVPDLFKGLIDKFWIQSLPVIRFEPSPKVLNDPPASSLISVGGPKFNAVTDYYLRTRGGVFFTQYKDENLQRWRIVINSGNRKGEIIGADFQKTEVDIGYIQRFVDSETNATVILLAGLGVNGTRAAANYLATNWLRLHRRYGIKDFGVAIKCPDFNKDPEGYQQITVLTCLPT